MANHYTIVIKPQNLNERLSAGLVVLPGVLTVEEQQRILSDAFIGWPSPPNRTNHSAHLGPLPGLWAAAQAVHDSPPPHPSPATRPLACPRTHPITHPPAHPPPNPMSGLKDARGEHVEYL